MSKGKDADFKRLVAQETLILEATELIAELIEQSGMKRKDLAKKLGRSKGFVTQVLSGDRNMTLRTLADFAYALGQKLEVRLREPEGGRIANLATLEPGWDGHGGDPPTEKALARLRGFDRALSYVPMSDGGIQVEFHALGLDFEIVIGPNGEVAGYLLDTPSFELEGRDAERPMFPMPALDPELKEGL